MKTSQKTEGGPAPWVLGRGAQTPRPCNAPSHAPASLHPRGRHTGACQPEVGKHDVFPCPSPRTHTMPLCRAHLAHLRPKQKLFYAQEAGRGKQCRHAACTWRHMLAPAQGTSRCRPLGACRRQRPRAAPPHSAAALQSPPGPAPSRPCSCISAEVPELQLKCSSKTPQPPATSSQPATAEAAWRGCGA